MMESVFVSILCTLFTNSSKDSPQSSDSDLLYHPDLQPLIQAQLCLIICTTCQLALLAKSVVRHFSEKHKDFMSQLMKKGFLQVHRHGSWQIQCQSSKLLL